MIKGEFSLADCGESVSIKIYNADGYELRIGNAPIMFISKEQAVNLKAALNEALPESVKAEHGVAVRPVYIKY